MKFIADNIKELSRKNKDKNIKKTIRIIRSKVKSEAKNGEDKCFVDFYENFNDNQQEVISDYFVKKGFKVEWRFDDRIMVKWV
jgi:hypothetical protein